MIKPMIKTTEKNKPVVRLSQDRTNIIIPLANGKFHHQPTNNIKWAVMKSNTGFPQPPNKPTQIIIKPRKGEEIPLVVPTQLEVIQLIGLWNSIKWEFDR